MKCMSCGESVAHNEGKLFAQVFCCEGCYTVASRFMERAERDIASIKLMMTEVVRHGLLSGELQFSSGDEGPVEEEDLLGKLSNMARKAKESKLRMTEQTDDE